METFRRLSIPARIAVVVLAYVLVVSCINALGDAISSVDDTRAPRDSTSVPADTVSSTVPASTSTVDTTTSTTTTTTTTTVPPKGGTTDPLAGLVIAAENRAGYDRDLFDHWIDADGDGCNTRYEVLIAESRTPVRVGAGCTLTGGSWVSPYDGVATTLTSDLDIDHMVPLAEAWDSGANGWTAARRRAFANDLDLDSALIAVTDNLNQQKSDQDPAEWLPPRAAYRCTYVRNWVTIKRKWDLTIDRAEASALRSVLANC